MSSHRRFVVPEPSADLVTRERLMAQLGWSEVQFNTALGLGFPRPVLRDRSFDPRDRVFLYRRTLLDSWVERVRAFAPGFLRGPVRPSPAPMLPLGGSYIELGTVLAAFGLGESQVPAAQGFGFPRVVRRRRDDGVVEHLVLRHEAQQWGERMHVLMPDFGAAALVA